MRVSSGEAVLLLIFCALCVLLRQMIRQLGFSFFVSTGSARISGGLRQQRPYDGGGVECPLAPLKRELARCPQRIERKFCRQVATPFSSSALILAIARFRFVVFCSSMR